MIDLIYSPQAEGLILDSHSPEGHYRPTKASESLPLFVTRYKTFYHAVWASGYVSNDYTPSSAIRWKPCELRLEIVNVTR